jgi:hypothetical protein
MVCKKRLTGLRVNKNVFWIGFYYLLEWRVRIVAHLQLIKLQNPMGE